MVSAAVALEAVVSLEEESAEEVWVAAASEAAASEEVGYEAATLVAAA